MKTDSSFKNIKSDLSHKQKDNFTNYDNDNDNDDDIIRKLDRYQNNKLLGSL
jgi:hypothetical protein